MKLIYLILAIFLFSCMAPSLNVIELDIIKGELANKEINVGRDNETFHIGIKYDSSFVWYSFRHDDILNSEILKGQNNLLPYIEDSLKNEAIKAFDLIEKYNIYGSTEKFHAVGIPLKVYMKGRSVYLFCPDTSILSSTFKQYIDKADSMGSGWYYKSKDE